MIEKKLKMGRQVELKGVKYSYEFGYRDNDILRKSFNSLAAKTFDIDFEEWYKDGYWGNGYIPHSLVLDNVIVANVSVSIMYFKIFGEKKKYIQLGTVMTECDYRGAGLSRFLMEEVLKEWEDKNVYYIEDDETIVIASYDDTALNIQEIFSAKEVELNSIIEKMIINDVDKVILGFTPFDKSGYKESILREDDTTLFVKEGKINPFKINKLRFPELSHT